MSRPNLLDKATLKDQAQRDFPLLAVGQPIIDAGAAAEDDGAERLVGIDVGQGAARIGQGHRIAQRIVGENPHRPARAGAVAVHDAADPAPLAGAAHVFDTWIRQGGNSQRANRSR